MASLRSQFLPCEIGGVLVGYFDFNNGENTLNIVDAMPPPPGSIGTPSCFIRKGGQELANIIQDVRTRTMGIVSYIGEWHSHPDGHSTKQSSDDAFQIKCIAEHMNQDGLPGIQIIVGEGGYNIYLGDETNDC